MLGGRAVGGDVLGQLGMVMDGAALPEPGGQGGGEAAAQDPQKGRQAAAVRQLRRLEAGQQDAGGGHEEKRHAQAHEGLYLGDVAIVHLVVEGGAHEARRPDHQEGAPGQQPQVGLVRELAHQR